MSSPARPLHGLLEPLHGLLEPLRGLLPSAGRSTARGAAAVPEEEHVTPWSWVDDGGLYHGNDGAWLYRELPLTLLTPIGGRIPLDQMIDELAAQLPDRHIHLASHTWETGTPLPDGTPEPLADYLTAALTFLVPTRTLLIGVQLRAAAPAGDDSKLRVLLPELLTSALGEAVPDLSRYDADRDLVSEALDPWTTGVPGRSATEYLEGWHTLGNGPDERVRETQDAILVGEYGAIECAAVMTFTAGPALAAPLPSPGEGGALVVSVRGQLTDSDGSRKSDHLRPGTLRGCSIVLGRRTGYALDAWVDVLRNHPGIELRPLPLRQLAALDETLPCSARRVSPTLPAVTGTQLVSTGVREAALAGDPAGLYLGLADPDLSHPCYLNPNTGGAVTLVTGGEGAGKTFLAEALAVQAGLAGLDVVVLSTRPRQTSAVLELVGGMDVALGRPGHLDPFAHTDPQRAAELAAAALPPLVPGLTAEEAGELLTALQRGVFTGAITLQQCLEVIGEPAAVARLRRAQRRSPYLPLVVGDGGEQLVAPGVTVVDVGWLLPLAPETGPRDPDAAEDNDAAALLLDLAVACVLERAMTRGSAAGTLIVLDGGAAVLSGPMTAGSLARLRAQTDRRVHLLVTTAATRQAVTSPLGRDAERVIALAETDPAAAEAAQQLVGLPPTEARTLWLTEAGPQLADGKLLRPALALHRDAHGRRASLLVGPVPPAALPALTHGGAGSS